MRKYKIFSISFRPLFLIDRRIQHPNWKIQYRLCVTNYNISQKLKELGCFQAKSLSLKFPTTNQVPERLLRHFIRGYFDGGGCFSLYKPKKRNSTYCEVGLVSTNSFCQSIQNITNKILNVYSKISDKHNNGTKTFKITGHNNCNKFLEWIYKDSTIFLPRKFNKFLELKELISL